MNIVEKLDLAIKSKETGTTEGFYAVPYKGGTLNKPTYMTNEEWNTFLSAMPEVTRKEYGEGDGDELREKDGVLYPLFERAKIGENDPITEDIIISSYCVEISKELEYKAGEIIYNYK